MTRQLMNDSLIAHGNFSEQALIQKYEWLKPYRHGTHETGSKTTHETNHYQFLIAPDIYAHWSICTDCWVVRTKKLIGYIKNDEDGYATAVVHDIVVKGEKV